MIMVQALLIAGVPAAEIRCYPLDERSVYTIRVSDQEPTTCVFPAGLRALVGANVSTKAEEQPGILLSHQEGAEYFSVRALQAGAKGALNVILRGKVYALAFVGATEPDRAVVFLDQPLAGSAAVPPAERLRGLVDRAKQELRGAREPGMTSKVEVFRPATRTAYRDFEAVVDAIVRFEAEDVLVLRVRLESRSERPVAYAPEGLAVRLDREIFPAVLAEGSGGVPARGVSVAFIALAGTTGGGRANFSGRENFNVIVPQP
jgi:hypothetical protein